MIIKTHDQILAEATAIGLNLNYQPIPIMNDIRLLPDEYWHKSRFTGWGGSNEGALNGISHYSTIQEAVKEKISGIKVPVDTEKQHLFDYGHINECLMLKRYAVLGGYQFITYKNYFVIVETTDDVAAKHPEFKLAQENVYSFLTQDETQAKNVLANIQNDYPEAKLIAQDTMEPKDIRDITAEEHELYDMQGYVCVDRRQYRHPFYPHMIGDCDGICITGMGERIGLECKTYGHLFKGTFTDGILGDPGVLIKNEEYKLQCAHYMAVLNLDRFDIIASCGNLPTDVTVTIVYRDVELEKELCENCEAAWEYVENGKVPKAHKLKSTSFENLMNMLKKYQPERWDAAEVEVSNIDIENKIKEIEAYNDKIKNLSAQKENLTEFADSLRYDISLLMDGHSSVKLVTDSANENNYIISLEEAASKRIDEDQIKLKYPAVYKEIFAGPTKSKLLKDKYPAIYDECTYNQISSTKFKIKKVKKK